MIRNEGTDVKGFSATWVADVGIRVLTILKGSPVAKGGLVLIGTGALLVGSGWIWAVVALLRQASVQEAIQHSSPSSAQLAIGAAAMAAGTLLLLSTMVTQWRTKAPVLVALRHQSFDGNSRALEASDLPPKLKGADVLRLDVNQSSLFRNGVLAEPRMALLQQDTLPAQLRAHLHAHPDATVAYCGKAHIPLAFAAAHVALSEVRINYFELERNKAGWRWLDDTAEGEDLALQVEHRTTPTSDGEAVISVEVSYGIKKEEIAAIVPKPAADVRIAVAKPRIDCITTTAQVEAIAAAFRQALDDLQNALVPITRIHVFIAAPMSVVVALGRLASPTIHKPIIVHNYSDKTVPRYAWGIEVNANGGPRVLESNVKAVA